MTTPSYHSPLARFYFVYYLFVGVFVPYWTMYLRDQHFSVVEIGEVMALFQLCRVFAPTLWGWLADYSGRRVVWIKCNVLLGVLGFSLIFWHPPLAGLVVVMLALGIFTHSALPLAESLTFLFAPAQDAGHYGRIRKWGSWGFVVSALLLGSWIDITDVGAVPWFLWGMQLSLLWLAYQLPEPTVDATLPVLRAHSTLVQVLRHSSVCWILLASILTVTAHSVLYNFYSLYLAEHGYSHRTIGILWSLGVVCEILMFSLMARLKRIFSDKTILLLSLTCAVVRFTLISLGVDSLWWLTLAQILHAATFASFHAIAIEQMNIYFTGKNQARGQAIYHSATYGFGGAIGGLAGGYIWQYWGGAVTFLWVAVLPLCAVVLIYYRFPKNTATKEGTMLADVS